MPSHQQSFAVDTQNRTSTASADHRYAFLEGLARDGSLAAPDCDHWLYVPDSDVDTPYWGLSLDVDDRSEASPSTAEADHRYALLESLVRDGAITQFQAHWLHSQLPDLPDDWYAHPYCHTIREHTRVLIGGRCQDERPIAGSAE